MDTFCLQVFSVVFAARAVHARQFVGGEEGRERGELDRGSAKTIG